MATLIQNCLARLVKQGRISQKAADAAEALHEGIQGRLGETMSPTHADAAAALEAARVMAEAARQRKLSIAKQAITADRAMQRVAAHPRGKAAGLMAEMSTDIHGRAAGANIEALTEVIAAKMMGFFRAGAEAMQSRWAGLVQDRAVADRFVDELFGVNSGDATAKAAADGFKQANEYGVARAQQGGRLFTAAEDWRIPQHWNSGRVKSAGEAAFTRDLFEEINRGALRVFSKRTGAPADATEIANIVKQAYDDITINKSGAAEAFSSEMRVFRFADGQAGADAWKRLMGKYGPGRDIYGLVTGHIQSMAREIAFVDQWGPDYRATFSQLHETLERSGEKGTRFLRWIESPKAAERTFKVLTGEASMIQSEAWAGIMGGIRSGLSAAQLGSAIIPSVFGDSVTASLAAKWNGISGMKVVARALDQMIRDNPQMRADLARLQLTAYAVNDSLVGSARYLDETFGSTLNAALRGEGGVGAARRFSEFMAGTAQFVIRAQGLTAWTNAMKRAFSMEMLAYAGSQSTRSWSRLDEPFKRFLQARGFSAGEWDGLRGTPLVDVGGAKFFDADGVTDGALREKFLAAIIDERRYAVLEPSARLQGFTTQGLPRGSLGREILNSVFMYRSFPMMMLVMHGGRLFSQIDEPMSRAVYFAKLMLLGTMAGAAVIQTKSLLQGKDPRPMNTVSFWGAASIQGGGLGIFGDLFYEGFTRGGTTFATTLAGPIGGAFDSVGRLLFAPARDAFEGEPVGLGREFARFMRWNTPGTNLWFSRLAVDRLVWDQIELWVDPVGGKRAHARQASAAQRDYGQRFWWGPGSATPQRAPDMGNALPN